MKYVRNLDDLKRYTFEFFDSFLPENLSDKMVNLFLLDVGDKEELFLQAKKYVDLNSLNSNTVAEYGEVILQLGENKELLKYFVELLLFTNSFDALGSFLNRIFLQQIGNKKYHSSRQEYTISQRYFDRFVEIINFCEIDKSLYTPFFVAIFNSEPNSKLFFYKEPLKEYIDTYLSSGTDNFASKLIDDKAPFNQSNIQNLHTLVESFVKGEVTNANLLKNSLQLNRQLSLNMLQEYVTENESQTINALELISTLEYKSAKEYLKKVYDTTKNENIKQFVAKKLGINSLNHFASEQEFLEYVDGHISNIQDRLYGIRLARFYDEHSLDNSGINGKILTFVLEFCRGKNAESQIGEFKEYFKFVNMLTLQKLCAVVFEVANLKDKLLSSKWAMRLISVFGSADLLEMVFNKMKNWYLLPNLVKACEYFLDVMIQCKREEVLQGLSMLLELNIPQKRKKVLESKLAVFSQINKEDLEQVKDKFASDLGFDSSGSQILTLNKRTVRAQINPDCTISLFGENSNRPARISKGETINWQDVHTFIKNLENKIKAQKKRLYQAFLEFRIYDEQSFKDCILNNNLLNFLSQHLFWGRYKNDNLVEICIIKNGRLTHLLGSMISENLDEYSISLLQPMDFEEVKDKLEDTISPLFNQFDLPYFSPYDINQNVNYVDNFAGKFCNAQLFITRLQRLKYKIADLDSSGTFGMLYKVNENLNLITTVEFERVSTENYNQSTSLKRIYFYDLDKQIKKGKTYAFDKSFAIMPTNINPHVLSNELGLILKATKN